ncbi:MAG: sugar ABC transporter substrate-binding protein [Firmicutes bacterium]|nr:sugar ABC transporter substrate-binding protein [Bacillota bacterium]
MRRVAILSIAALLMACMFSAVAYADVKLSYRIWDVNQAPAMEAIAREFEEQNPGIRVEVEVIPWAQYWTNLETAATGRNLPDVFWLNASNFELYASNDLLVPIESLLETSYVSKEDYPESLIELYTYSGHLYAMPKDMDTIGLWYNKELFDAAGVAYPDETWTWDDLVEAAVALTDAENRVWGIAAELSHQSGFFNTVYQAGGWIVNEDKTKAGHAEPESLEGLRFWTDLIHAHKASPTMAPMTDTEPISLFESGRAAMFYTGSWNQIRFMNNEYTRDRVDVAVLPKGKQRAVIIHGLGNVIAANTRHPEEAWKFVEFLGSKRAHEIQAQTGTVIPARLDLHQAWVDSNPNFNLQIFLDQLEDAVPYPVSVQARRWQQIQIDCLTPAWAGEQSIEEAAKETARQIDQVLAEERR